MNFALCKDLADLPKKTGNMLWQQKLDGVRAFVSESRIQLRTISFENNGIYVPAGCVLDGEIIGDRFSDVVPALTRGDWDAVRFVPFDIVKHEDDDMRNEPLLVRLNVLAETSDDCLPIFAFPDEDMPDVPKEWEGVIGKPMLSPYRAGRMSWVKWKHVDYTDAIILNYEEGRGRWAGGVGKVVFKSADGTVGTAAGFDERTRKMLTLNGVEYIGKPCVIKHYGMNKRRLRNPVFHGLKESL